MGLRKIHIIGGGITGLSTGLVLEKLGLYDYCIFERASILSEVGAGIMLQPNAMKILDWLGLASKMVEAGHAVNRAEITNRYLVPLRRAVSNPDSVESGHLMVAIHRARLQEILYQSLPYEKVQLGQALIDLEEKEETVNAIFADGPKSSQIILASDGINSSVRKRMFPNAQTRFSGQTCWRGIADMPSSQDELAIATEAWGPKLRFGFVRISSKEMYWYAVQNAERDGRDSGDSKSKLLDKFKIFHPKVCKIIDLTSVDRIIRNDIYDLKRLPSWSLNNICLLGDAAHATTPNMGQGACQGIEDAFAIGHELAGVHDHVGSAFQQFEERRRQKVDQIVNTSWQLGKMAHQPQLQYLARLFIKLAPDRILKQQMHDLFTVDGLG